MQQAGFNVMLLVASPAQPVEEALRLLLSYHPEFIIILATSLAGEAAGACQEAGTPVLFLNRHSADPRAHAVICDNRGGAAQVADHLIDGGARRLGFIGGQPGTSTNAERAEGFRARCLARGLPPPLELEAGAFTYQAGYDAALRCLGGPGRPEALFCASDILAAGAMDAARLRLGLRVPEDLAFAGFDDIALASWPSYDLTTLRQPLRRMIELAVEWITRSARGEPLPGGIERIPGELVPRRSSARPADTVLETPF
ncbi:substrate-binding domain-containing protein [Roseomonas marmotae]|uniref:substrate-binding domain-containing protein n=1 Tax=Roseomonas marmotae TaxID=2768161 RepID=UPI001AD6FFA1|nr:substrate-binding domain-containing protein [Roseomonas marmotae]QTI80378.1 substrate-binding domain-containing protein [Roseomonas marmotae]